MHNFKQVTWLAYRDFMYERRVSLCFVLALMAVLGPLLVLFALKFGLIDTLTQRLVESPHYREIIALGSRHHEKSWFKEIADRPDVAFIIPNTRYITASITRLINPASGKSLKGVQMIPTGPGDPLIEELPTKPTQINEAVSSSLAAYKLDIKAGDILEAQFTRLRNKVIETVKLPLKIVGIASEKALQEEGLFVPLNLLVATENYRDGIAVSQFGWPGTKKDGPPSYVSFRLYAKSIYDVSTLRDVLRKDGVEVRTQANEIEAMQSLDQNLTHVFWLIASIALIGFLVSLAANLLANVDRKRRELSVIGMLGVSSKYIVLFPVIQASLVGILGVLFAGAAYFPVAKVLNVWFQDSLRPGEFICKLHPSHFFFAAAGTLLCSVAAATWAGFRVSQIEPAEGIRDV